MDFFSDQPKMDRNQQISDATTIMSAIYDRGSDFRKRPSCRIYYVTTGRWPEDDKNLTGRRDTVVADLKKTEMFEEIDFRCSGADDILHLYQNTKNE